VSKKLTWHWRNIRIREREWGRAAGEAQGMALQEENRVIYVQLSDFEATVIGRSKLKVSREFSL
jgi:hypothetical protein